MAHAPAIPNLLRTTLRPARPPAASPGLHRLPRPRPARSGAHEIAAGALLAVLWVLLWSVFVSGVLEPAARVQGVAARHPSLDVGAAVAAPEAQRVHP